MQSSTAYAQPEATGGSQPEGPALPTAADLNKATQATAAALADPDASVQDVCRAAELEAATLHAFAHAPGAEAELEAAI